MFDPAIYVEQRDQKWGRTPECPKVALSLGCLETIPLTPLRSNKHALVREWTVSVFH